MVDPEDIGLYMVQQNQIRENDEISQTDSDNEEVKTLLGSEWMNSEK